jgi:hypothetical protein
MRMSTLILPLLALSPAGCNSSLAKVDADITGQWEIELDEHVEVSTGQKPLGYAYSDALPSEGGFVAPVVTADGSPLAPGVTISCEAPGFLCPSEVLVLDQDGALVIEPAEGRSVEIALARHLASCEGEGECATTFPEPEIAAGVYTLDAYGGLPMSYDGHQPIDACVARLSMFVQFRDLKGPDDTRGHRVADTMYGSIGLEFPTACVRPDVLLPSEVPVDERNEVRTWIRQRFVGRRRRTE